MKQKGMVYMLGVLVFTVWGLIIYRLLAAVNQDNHDDRTSFTQSIKKEVYNDFATGKDTARLLLDYRNPFNPSGITDSAKPISTGHTTRGILNTPGMMKQPLNWSFIKYAGFIRNPDTKKLIAILNINGKNAMLAEGESAEDVSLVKNLRDSILITFKKQHHFILMNKSAL